MTNFPKRVDQLTKKLNALILCHLPVVFIGIASFLGFSKEQFSIVDFDFIYALVAISLPPIALLLRQSLNSETKFKPKHAHLILSVTLATHLLILGCLPLEQYVGQFKVLIVLEQALLASFILNRAQTASGEKGNKLFSAIIIGNTLFLATFLFLATPQFPLRIDPTVLKTIIHIDAAIISILATLLLWRARFPEKNSRLYAIISYSVVQTSLIFFFMPTDVPTFIVSLLSLGTIFAISLDFVLLKPSVLLESGFSFLNVQNALKHEIAKVNETLKQQAEKTSQIEQQLSDTVLLAAATLDSMSVLVCIVDIDGKIISVNKAWRHLYAALGDKAQMHEVANNLLDACDKDESENRSVFLKISEGLRSVMSGVKSEFVTQIQLSSVHGRQWFLFRMGRFESNLGIRFMIVQENITDLKAAEEELLLKSIAIERANDGIVVTNPNLPDNPIVSVSPGFLKLTGYTQEEVLGRNCRFMQGPASDPAVIERMRTAIQNEESFDGEIINYTKSGHPWFNRLKLEPVRNSEGKLIRYVGVQLDVSSIRKLEKERRRALEKEMAARQDIERLYREAQNANTIKDEFLATLSHELRTPAGVIVGFTELVKYEDLSPQERDEALDAIERNARALVTLIDDMLDMNRVITGKFKLNPKPVDLNAILDSVISAEMLAAQSKNIRLVTEFDPGSGPIFGDVTRLQQIFWNLLSNAIKFTPRNGRVKVSVRPEGSRIVVRVSDTGVGIDAQFLPHIFERFRQQESGMNRSYGGLGLGLSIVKHLVELHGGAVSAESAGTGRGATFIVSLPALTAAG